MRTAKLQLIPITSADQYQGLTSTAGLPPLDLRWLSAHRPDAHWVVANQNQVTARCSLWWRKTPTIPQGKLGLIGHYAAIDDHSAAVLLEFVSAELSAKGCASAVGPMDQNTWRDYRFITRDSGYPSFFREPTNLPEWPGQFARAHFREIASYFSSVVDDLTIKAPRVERARSRLARRGVHIRPMERDRIESDLKQIYAVARIAFQENLFYQGVSEAEFLDQYCSLQDVLPTELVLLALRSDRVIGFCFAMPDLLQSERGQAIDTVIIKTFGVLPGLEYAGLGQVLLEKAQQTASALGFRRGIHALVRDVGQMRRISQRYAVPFRHYALFGKELSR